MILQLLPTHTGATNMGGDNEYSQPGHPQSVAEEWARPGVCKWEWPGGYAAALVATCHVHEVTHFNSPHDTQALMCFSDAVKSQLNDIKGLESAGLASQAQKVKVQLDVVTSFCLQSVEGDPSLLECSARDLAFSMAHVYISELCIGKENCCIIIRS